MKYPPLVILIVCLALALPSPGQDPRPVPAPAFGEELPYTEVLVPPMPVRERMPLALSTELRSENFLRMGIEVGTAFDDNALLTSTAHSSDVSYIFLPNVEIGQSRPRTRWGLTYRPGFTINHHLSERNQMAHGLAFIADYRLTPHVAVRLREGLDKTNNTFSGLLQGAQAPGSVPGQAPNFSSVTPLAERTSNISAVDLTYQFGANSMAGVSGNYYFSNYSRDTSATVALLDSSSAGGDAFYAHRFANRHWAGLMYNFQRLQFQPGNRTNVQRLPLFYALSLGSHVVLSLWAGPEYSVTPYAVAATTQPGATARSRVGGTGGGDLTWQGNRTSIRAGFLQQTTDGGGLAEAAVLKDFRAELRRRLSTRWTVTAVLTRSQNNPLYPVASSLPYLTWTGGGGFEYAFSEHWAARLGYTREHLDTQTHPPTSATNRNRVLFSVSYLFSRPLGR